MRGGGDGRASDNRSSFPYNPRHVRLRRRRRLGRAVSRHPRDAGPDVRRHRPPRPRRRGVSLNHEAEITPDARRSRLAFRRLAILDPDPRQSAVHRRPRALDRLQRRDLQLPRAAQGAEVAADPTTPGGRPATRKCCCVAYDVWGEKCVEQLNGMFAFAVWDEQEQDAVPRAGSDGAEAAVLRDCRAGQRLTTLAAVAVSRAELVDARSPRAAVRCRSDGSIDRRCARCSYLRYGYIRASQTIYAARHQPGAAGGAIAMRSGPATVLRPEARRSQPTRSGRRDARRPSARRRAVARQLVSDVPLGCFLSGGIDSSVIAAAMMRRDAARDGADVLDRLRRPALRRDAIRRAGRRSTSARASRVHASARRRRGPAEARGGVRRAVRRLVRAADALPRARDARAREGRAERRRRRRAVRRIRPLPRDAARPATAAPTALRRFVAAASSRRCRGGASEVDAARGSSGSLASLELDAAERYDAYMRLFDDATIARAARRTRLRPPRRSTASTCVRARHAGRHRDAVAAGARDRPRHVPARRPAHQSRPRSMLHGLEVRSPFMDHELVQFAAGLTTDQLLKGGPKRMLREAFADDLPDCVFKRKKMGFAVPIGDWFRGELRPMLRDHLFAADSFGAQHFNMTSRRAARRRAREPRVDHSQRLYACSCSNCGGSIRRPDLRPGLVRVRVTV